MNSKIGKLAAAAVLVVAIFIPATFFVGTTGGVTWAQVIKPILKANTAAFDIVIGDENAGAPVIHDVVMGSRIRRTSTLDDEVAIIDLENSRILTLSQDKKEAQYINLEGLPPIPNYLERVKGLVEMFNESSQFVIEDLGEREIDGHPLVGFVAKHPRAEITIWADPETGLPVRIDQNEGQLLVICKNMRFDVPIDESHFSMEVPEGYTLKEESTLDLLGSTEADFIAGLRVLAETFGGGQFPDGVSVEDYLRQASDVAAQIAEMGYTTEQETALGEVIQKYLLFTRMFQGDGKWYYRGQGVMLGDAETAIFWYRPKGSPTYRVIYGDLHVEDVASEDLPEPLDPDDTAGMSGFEFWSEPNFLGSQEDHWTVDADGIITVASTLILSNGPEGVATLPVTLPYASGTMTAVALAGEAVPFTAADEGQYELTLPLEMLAAGQRTILCQWSFSLGELPEKRREEMTYYEVALKTLIPVTSYSVTAHLAPDSGYEFSLAPSQSYLMLFSNDRAEGGTDLGTCGLPIRPRR